MASKERTLFCGNLADKVTEDILYELFLQAGPLENVSIPKDKEGNRRNFGFVTFKHPISVQYAVALMNGVTLYSKQLRLDARTGAESEPNAYMQALERHRQSCAFPERYDRPYPEARDGRGYGYDRRDSFGGDRFGVENRRYPNDTPPGYPSSYRHSPSYLNSNFGLDDFDRTPNRASPTYRSRMDNPPWRRSSNY